MTESTHRWSPVRGSKSDRCVQCHATRKPSNGVGYRYRVGKAWTHNEPPCERVKAPTAKRKPATRGKGRTQRGTCPVCRLAGPEGLRAEKRTITVEMGGREYQIPGVPGHVCNGGCEGAWWARVEWGDGSRRNHRAYRATWSRHRAWFLSRNPVCERCKAATATEAHHRVYRSQGGGDEERNLEALCQACHEAEHRPAPRERTNGGLK